MSIQGTRRGFLYQDRIAVCFYLKELLDGNIQEFYIDFPYQEFEHGKSIDIRHIDSRGQEIVYEVKSGENFKKDIKRKNKKGINTSEIQESFLTLMEYADLYNDAKIKLIFRNPMYSEISEYYSRLLKIQKYERIRYIEEELKWLLCKLDLQKTEIQTFFKFCKRIYFCPFDSDKKDYEQDRFPDIDDKVISAINNLAAYLEVNDNLSFGIPSEFLMYTLYHKAALYAGDKSNVHPIFFETIQDFFIKRKYTESCEHPRDRHSIFKKCKNEVKELMGKLCSNPIFKNEPISIFNKSEGMVLWEK